MWPLLACSFVALSVIFERSLFWVQIRKRRNRQLMDEILHLAESGEWEAIKEKSQGCEDHVIKMINIGIMHRNWDMSKAMASEAQYRVKKMAKYMTILDTMITVTPLLGILGTVIGIISSFKILGSGGITDPKLVTSGIAQALITTATGLTISIATVFPYNYFKSRIDHAADIMEKYGTSLEVVHNKLLQEKDEN